MLGKLRKKIAKFVGRQFPPFGGIVSGRNGILIVGLVGA
jgi:hypothetical protein